MPTKKLAKPVPNCEIDGEDSCEWPGIWIASKAMSNGLSVMKSPICDIHKFMASERGFYNFKEHPVVQQNRYLKNKQEREKAANQVVNPKKGY
jgi:hypothetical protein